MANIKSQIKRNAQNEKRRLRNKSVKSSLKTAVRRFRDVAGAKADSARIVNESQGYANDLVPKARGEAQKLLEEAAAYQQLIEDFSLTHDDVATRVGKSRTTITNTLRLLQLPPSIQRYLKERALRMGHARALLGTPDRAFQEQLAKRAVAEELSVREVEERAKNVASPFKKLSAKAKAKGKAKDPEILRALGTLQQRMAEAA